MRVVRAVVPAAGLSSRFSGSNKLLFEWLGKSIVRRVVETLNECNMPVTVVTGRDSELVQREANGAKMVFNPDFETGLGSSIAIGVKSLDRCDGILIALGDMPGIRPDVIQLLTGQFQAALEDAIIAPVYDAEPERLGHPILFSSSYRADLESLTGDEGARSIIHSNSAKVVRVLTPGRLDDIDTNESIETSNR